MPAPLPTQHQPLLALAAAYALGCFTGGDAGARAGVLLLALTVAALGLALYAPPEPARVALAAAALALGAAGAAVETEAYDRTPLAGWLRAQGSDDGLVRLRGTAVRPVPRDGGRHPLLLQVDGLGFAVPPSPVAGRARVEIGGGGRRDDIAEGDRLELMATLSPPRPARSPGAFDTERWARRERLHGLGYCKSPLLVKQQPGCGASSVACATSVAREWARDRLRRHVPLGAPQGLVRAMVLGDRSGLDDDTAEAFRRAGTFHVLALSGAQVALVAGLLVAAGRRLQTSPLLLATVVSSVLAAYALFVGGDVPVSRAAVMAIVLVLGRGLDLDADLANLLGGAALLLLAANPAAIGDVGFQLSFVATLAIVMIAPVLSRPLAGLPWGLGALIAGSVAAQAALQPLLAQHFHRLAPAALGLNLAAVPLSGGVLLVGAMVLPVSLVSSWLADRVGELAWMVADLLLRTCDGGGVAAAVDWRAPDPTLLVLVPWALGLRALARGQWGRGVALSALVTVGLRLGPGPQADGRFELAVLDVGQGDGLVLRSPSGRAMVVDAGLGREGFDLGERVIAPFLWSYGVRGLDRLVLTHAHPDHAGGIPFLLSAFDTSELWEGIAPLRDRGYDELARTLDGAGTARRSVARGMRLAWDGASLEVLSPMPTGHRPARTRNDDSVVLAVRYGSVCMLLTGDIEATGESTLATPPCTIFKVPHHGSRTSTGEAVLDSARPKLAVISVGARNRFSHPHPDVVRRLGEHGVRIFRTDRDGTVRLATDGERVWVRLGLGGVEARVR